MLFKGFSIFSYDGHFVQLSGTILAYLVEGYPRKMLPKKLFENWPTGIGVDISKVFLVLLWQPSCLSERKDFIYFGREPTRHHSCEV